MKKIILIFAIIALFAMAFNAFGDALLRSSPGTDVTSDIVTSSSDSDITTTDTSDVVTEPSYTYSYTVNVYKQGTTTKLGDIELESNNPTATLQISGNLLRLDAGDKSASIQFTDMKSIDSISESNFSHGTSSVYITYTEKTSSGGSTHTHSYTTTKAATCTSSGTKTCSCGATQTIPATGHSWDSTSAIDCQCPSICFDCDASGGPVGPHTDEDNDGKCDLCNVSM